MWLTRGRFVAIFFSLLLHASWDWWIGAGLHLTGGCRAQVPLPLLADLSVIRNVVGLTMVRVTASPGSPPRDVKRSCLFQNRSVKISNQFEHLKWLVTALIRLKSDYGSSLKNRTVEPKLTRQIFPLNWLGTRLDYQKPYKSTVRFY